MNYIVAVSKIQTMKRETHMELLPKVRRKGFFFCFLREEWVKKEKLLRLDKNEGQRSFEKRKFRNLEYFKLSTMEWDWEWRMGEVVETNKSYQP